MEASRSSPGVPARDVQSAPAQSQVIGFGLDAPPRRVDAIHPCREFHPIRGQVKRWELGQFSQNVQNDHRAQALLAAAAIGVILTVPVLPDKAHLQVLLDHAVIGDGLDLLVA